MTDPPSSDLWAWTVNAYGAQGVSDVCVDLQNTAAQNVPLLLWAAWTAAPGRPLDDDTVEAACDCARAWDTSTITPLRAIRHGLKGPIPDIDDAARQTLREAVKAVELAAESHLMAGLQALTPPATGTPRPSIEALVDVARSWSRMVPRPALVTLAERLPT